MRLGVSNLGNGTARQVRGDLMHLMCLTDMLCTQESLDRHDEIDAACHASGWERYYAGTGRNVIMWDKRVPVHRHDLVQLSPRTGTGNPPGPRDTAGPDVVNAKDMPLVRVQGFGWVGGAHLPASQWWPPRRRLALDNTRDMADWSLGRYHLAIGADWNCKPTSGVLKPLRKAGLVSSQDFKRLGTHHRRPIDAFMYKGLICLGSETLETTSDHDAYIVELERKERLR